MKEKTLWQTTGQIFLRFVAYHVMCIVVALSILTICPGVSGAYIAQGFTLGIIIVLPYMLAWKMGNDDINIVASGYAAEDRFKGLKAGWLAYIPFLLVAVAGVMTKLGWIPESFFSYYRLIESPFFALNQAILPTTYTLAEQSIGWVIVSALMQVLPPLAVGMGYWFGYENISFLDTYFPKKKKS